MPALRRLSFIPLVALLVLGIAACGDAGDESEASGNATEWPAFFELPDLVDGSDAIVVATLHNEEVETIEAPASEDGGGNNSITEIVRTFEVEDALKGHMEPGDRFHVFSTASVAFNPPDDAPPEEVVFQVLRLEDGDTVLLFLTMVELPEEYPEEWGAIAWAAPGEPHTARIGADGFLRWETTGRYDAAREARDIEAGDGGAGPEFDTTLDMVRALTQAPPTGDDGEASDAP